MALELYSNMNLFLRWLHVISGIVWIGMLYFFNFVNIPLQASLDDGAKKAVNPQLMPRALWWFRWGAMSTFIVGLILFTMTYMYTSGVGFGPNSLFMDRGGITPFTSRALWILFAMAFAAVMWFNVWFIIWPTQKKILSGQVPADQLPAQRAKAGKFSRINTFLSGPMLFGMLAAPHYSAINLVTWIVFVGIGMAAISLAYKTSLKAGKAV